MVPPSVICHMHQLLLAMCNFRQMLLIGFMQMISVIMGRWIILKLQQTLVQFWVGS